MSRIITRFAIPLLGGAAVSLALFSCSSDSKPSSTTPEAGTGTGGSSGSTGSGGAKSTGGGGAKSTGGAPAAKDAGNLYSCTPKTAGSLADGGTADPGGTVAAGAACCGVFGVCTKKADLKSDPASGAYGHADCKAADDLLCSPKPSNEIPDGGVTPPCHSKIGSLELEGRCLPKCFTLGNANASQINAGDCPTLPGTELVCAPCYDPTTGDKTGACDRPLAAGGTDKPAEPKKQFAECGAFPSDGGGAKQGLCVSKDLVAQTTANAASVPQDTCATGDLCAPKNKVLNQGSCFKHCTTSIGGPSACVPTYLVEAGAGKGFSGALGQADCADGETCAPCVSPIDQSVTGACAN
jgi:hypothetical protein